jgi:hypothetical protein
MVVRELGILLLDILIGSLGVSHLQLPWLMVVIAASGWLKIQDYVPYQHL